MTIHEYEICFEIFGKKMKTKIKALSEKDAERYLKNKIKVHSINSIGQEQTDSDFDKAIEMLDQIKNTLK